MVSFCIFLEDESAETTLDHGKHPCKGMSLCIFYQREFNGWCTRGDYNCAGRVGATQKVGCSLLNSDLSESSVSLGRRLIPVSRDARTIDARR